MLKQSLNINHPKNIDVPDEYRLFVLLTAVCDVIYLIPKKIAPALVL